MSLQYIIDGYNIINHPIFKPHITKRIRDSRVALLEFIRINNPSRGLKNKITVVFDGHADPLIKVDETDINIVFSRRETADERIKKMVEASGNPKNMVVVSDDKEIRFFVTSVGAKAMGVEEFINSKQRPFKENEVFLKPELTYTQMHKINQELRKIWLK